MRRGQRVLIFKKAHTNREIVQFILDPDAPELTLAVKRSYHFMKWVWVSLNVLATLVSCGALVWLSYPQYVETSASDGALQNMNFLTVAELLCVLFFTLDYALRFMFTDRTLWRFLVDPANIIDVFTTAPYYFQLILASANVRSEVFRVFFVFRMVRIIRLGKYHKGMQLIFSTLKYSYDMLLLFVCVVLLSIIIFATGLFYAERTRFDAESGMWMRGCPSFVHPNNTRYNCTEQPAPYQSIPEAMYWAVVMMTTVGHSIETPTTDLGKVIAAVTSAFGLFYFAAPATVLATNYKIFRKETEERLAQRKMDQRATMAMKAQEELRGELERVFRLQDNSGEVKMEPKRTLTKACTFEFNGVSRTIFEVIGETYYVYEPLAYLDREVDGSIAFTDDFNMTTAQRVLTAYLVVDCAEARQAARSALIAGNFISDTASEAECHVCADPECSITINHDYRNSYPDVKKVVFMDILDDCRNSFDERLPIRFCIEMPHMYPTLEVIELLRETRLHVALGMRRATFEMHIPLHVANIMASRFIRELYSIAYTRKTDQSSIAYIHPHDAAMLLEGFCDQFIPTPTPNFLMLAPHLVDQQVLQAIMSSFPLVKLEWIPPEAANAYYRSPHLNIDIAEEMLIEVNLSALSRFDELGYGNRFVIQCPIGEEFRSDVYFQIV